LMSGMDWHEEEAIDSIPNYLGDACGWLFP
jgi:hypothetical protein